jgi:hypothetical protein
VPALITPAIANHTINNTFRDTLLDCRKMDPDKIEYDLNQIEAQFEEGIEQFLDDFLSSPVDRRKEISIITACQLSKG